MMLPTESDDQKVKDELTVLQQSAAETRISCDTLL